MIASLNETRGANALALNAYELELWEQISQFYADPLGFVLFAFPWGERGPLERFRGPNREQENFLIDLGDAVADRKFDGIHPVEPIRMGITSGHGIGKTALAAFIVCWRMSTAPAMRGTVTANTNAQLQTKTWSGIQRWTKLLINRHWFDITSERMWRKGEKDDWFVNPLTCREQNSDAFNGQHAITSTSLYVFDEASGIPNAIWDAAEGGLTDGEPIFIPMGNPLRRSGKFFDISYGRDRKEWKMRPISAEDSEFANKKQIAKWALTKGVDSDFYRVRVKGLPPKADDLQFIDGDRVRAAMDRPAVFLPDDPLVCGVDVARGGLDDNCIRFRRGNDARSIKPIRIPGSATKDSSKLWNKLSQLLDEGVGGVPIAAMFVDGTGIGGPIVNRLQELGHVNVYEIGFGDESPDSHYANMRAYMWGRMRDWLLRGSIDDDDQLEVDLTGPGFHHDKSDRYVLESKEEMKARELDSPDDGDALALTFAMRVAQRKHQQGSQAPKRPRPWG